MQSRIYKQYKWFGLVPWTSCYLSRPASLLTSRRQDLKLSDIITTLNPCDKREKKVCRFLLSLIYHLYPLAYALLPLHMALMLQVIHVCTQLSMQIISLLGIITHLVLGTCTSGGATAHMHTNQIFWYKYQYIGFPSSSSNKQETRRMVNASTEYKNILNQCKFPTSRDNTHSWY